jgi:hypothetical protein
MDGNKEVTAHMPYADVVALGSLPSVVLSSTKTPHRIPRYAVASKR